MSQTDELDEIDRAIERGSADAITVGASIPTIPISALGQVRSPAYPAWWDGEKFPGGFGSTFITTPDYWTLRQRSAQLFRTNLYARGILRRFITNVINTGLHLECIPQERLLGLKEDALAGWSEDVETRWELWGSHAWLCDFREQQSFGALQATAYLEALIEGDILVVLRQDPRTGLPRAQLICGGAVQTPLGVPQRGNRIAHGVELDAQDRHVAYWVVQRDGTSKRLPAWGEKTGRRLAWLVYGTDKRLDDVRGEPILSLVLQSMKEIDRYRDSALRKAVINSILALFIKKTQDKMSTLPLSGGAVKAGTVIDDDGSGERSWRFADFIPGVYLEELQAGEEPVGFDNKGTDEKFGEFEESIVQAMAWTLEIPPEILRLAFSNNYSASQAAINEFKMALNRLRSDYGEAFCKPIYEEWLVSEVLNGNVEAAGLLEAWRDLRQYVVFGAWVASDWAGQIKPAVDLSKLVKGYDAMVASGYITRDRAARELTGTKYSRNVKRLRIENEQLAEANGALMPRAASSGVDPEAPRAGATLQLIASSDPDEDERATR